VWVIKKDDTIHRFKNGAWNQVTSNGRAVNVGASPDGWSWVVNRADDIFRYNPDTDSWQHIPGKLVQVSALSKDEAIGVNRLKNIYLWRNGAWQHVPHGGGKGLGNGAIWTALGPNDERWAIGPYHGIWRWDNKAAKWVAQPGGATTIDVHSPGRIVVTNKGNQAYTWIKVKKQWQHLAGKTAARATFGDGVLITLGADGFLSAIGY